ncbi:hypothetical protein L0P50_18010, partial [Lawsonibacter sp. DFI.6.74]|nr:hypothetical protein [Lawsonibacter sp. DFI.6.74]MCG4775008.1 hypothetical protein [Lawsonibacter sp. DFI.5.51]
MQKFTVRIPLPAEKGKHSVKIYSQKQSRFLGIRTGLINFFTFCHANDLQGVFYAVFRQKPPF